MMVLDVVSVVSLPLLGLVFLWMPACDAQTADHRASQAAQADDKCWVHRSVTQVLTFSCDGVSPAVFYQSFVNLSTTDPDHIFKLSRSRVGSIEWRAFSTSAPARETSQFLSAQLDAALGEVQQHISDLPWPTPLPSSWQLTRVNNVVFYAGATTASDAPFTVMQIARVYDVAHVYSCGNTQEKEDRCSGLSALLRGGESDFIPLESVWESSCTTNSGWSSALSIHAGYEPMLSECEEALAPGSEQSLLCKS